MNFPLRTTLLISLLLPAGNSRAQTLSAVTVPSRSIAMLVDVSGSVSPDFSKQARDIVVDIVTGRGFQPRAGWVCNFDSKEVEIPSGEDVWPPNEPLKEMFKPYWAGGSGQQKPITGQGKALYLAEFGNLKTTLFPPKSWAISSADDVVRVLAENFPQKFKDGHTCYYAAVARIADRLLDISEQGCYLFVASDEKDDPDWKHDGSGSWTSPLEEAGIYTANKYPSEVSKKIKDLKTTERFHLIARFHRDDRPPKGTGNKNSYLRLSWYAIGEKPAPVLAPVVPEKKPDQPPVPPPPPPPPPPAFARSLTLLGGLIAAGDPNDSAPPPASRIKVFPVETPFLTWQVEGSPDSTVDSNFDVTIRRLRKDGTLEEVQRVKSANLPRTSEGRLRGLRTGAGTLPLADGIYRITIEEKPAAGVAATGAKLLDPVATWINVQTPVNWQPWLLAASLLGAGGVIGYSMWTLRR